MDQRLDVTHQELTEALRMIGDGLQKRLEEKGGKSFIGLHEIDGILDEEVREWKVEVRGNDRKAAVMELLDVAVTAAFGIASVSAISRFEATQEVRPR